MIPPPPPNPLSSQPRNMINVYVQVNNKRAAVIGNQIRAAYAITHFYSSLRINFIMIILPK